MYEDISPEERRELNAQIDEALSRENIAATAQSMHFDPQRNGTKLPLAVNIAAVLLIGLVLLTALRFYGTRRSEMSLETRTYLTTERSIVETLIRESEEKLRKKNQEIYQIEQEVVALDRQIERLRMTLESNIRDREMELRRSMEQALRSERERLISMGYSDREIDARITELEERMSSEFRQELERYRQAERATFREREEELLEEKTEAEQRLERATREREELSSEARERQEELRAEYAEEKERLLEGSTEAELRFRAIAEQREKEQLITDQIQGSYAVIIEKIEYEDYAGASREISSLRELLLADSIDYLPTIVRRRKTDLFMIEMLSSFVASRRAGTRGTETTDATEGELTLREMRNRLARVRRLVEQADGAREAGELETAGDLYADALGQLPVMRQAYESLGSVEARRQRERLSRAVDEGSALAEQELFTRSIDRYREGVTAGEQENVDLLRMLLDGLQDSILRRQQRLIEGGADVAERVMEESRMKGRESAFIDTLRLMLYLYEQESGGAAAVDPEIERKLAQEPLFRSVSERLAALLEAGGTRDELRAADFQFVGVLVTLSGEDVIIEPLVSLPVRTGATIWIKRREESGKDVSVAAGTVASASSDRITARIDEIYTRERPPRISDLAYVRVR